MSAFWRFARLMLRDRGRLTAAMVFAFISAAGLGAGLLSLGPMLSIILDPSTEETLRSMAIAHNAADPAVAVPGWLVERLPTDPFRSVVLIVIVLAVLTVLGAVANFLHQYLSITVSAKTVALIRLDAFDHVVRLPLDRVVARGPSEFIARIIRDCAELQRGFIALTSRAVAQVTKGLAALVVALIVAPGLTLLFLILAPILGVILRKLGKQIRRGSRGALRAQEVLLRIAAEAMQGLRAVKVNAAERTATRLFHRTNREVVRQELRARTARALSGPLIETLAVLFVGGLALLAARAILAGDLELSRFILALGGLGVAGASFKPLAGLANEIHAADAPAERLIEILDEPREAAPGRRLKSLPRHRGSLAFERVTFAYPGSERPALDEIDLVVPHGERVAIVGPNGSGKTTLLSLVPRLLRPDRGRVLIDGVDVGQVSLKSLRRQIGVVTQETVLFRGTIAENIAFGHAANDAAVHDAARRAHADAFIRELPGGFDASVSEQGASLSGGQRQRIAIARAILRDPAILILDEATSQIDAESEAHITQALREFCVGRTSLIIAHRLSTVLDSDRIVVMDAGRIVDQGRHEELLDRCDLYVRLVRSHGLEGVREPAVTPAPGSDGAAGSSSPRSTAG